MNIDMTLLEGGKKKEPVEDLPPVKMGRLDMKGNGGAYHKYAITSQDTKTLFAGVDFQNGPIGEVGVNGCQNEDLLRIVIDRLQCFQAGEFACLENRSALECCEGALRFMDQRTIDRAKRGVEGKSKI